MIVPFNSRALPGYVLHAFDLTGNCYTGFVHYTPASLDTIRFLGLPTILHISSFHPVSGQIYSDHCL